MPDLEVTDKHEALTIDMDYHVTTKWSVGQTLTLSPSKKDTILVGHRSAYRPLASISS